MSSYTYTSNIPAATSVPASIQSNMQTNCNSISSLIGEDHYSFNVATGGSHKKVTLVDQEGDVTAVSGADIIYGNAVDSLIEIFMRRNGEDPIQMSTGTIVSSMSEGAAGQTFLPGGYQLKWGATTVSAGGTTTVTFTDDGLTAFPTRGVIGFVTAKSTGSTFNITSVTQTTVSIASPAGGGGTVWWIVIGN